MNQNKVLFILVSFSAAAMANASPFELLVTESPSGTNSNTANWLGIERFSFTNTGSAATALAGIPASAVSDPVGLCFSNGELFVGNRHGNSNPSSVSRFLYNASTDSFTANGTITGNGLFGAHGTNMRPTTNDLYVANVNTGISIFTVSPSSASANGTIFGGAIRDVLFSANGSNLYATQGVSGTIMRHDFSTNSDTNYSISGASGLHFGAWRGSHLFVSDISAGEVFDIGFDANGAITSSLGIAAVTAAGSVAFSPDNQEMFVSSHTGNFIKRFLFNSTTQNWDFQSQLNTATNIGDLQIVAVPEPSSVAILGVGVVALLRRRRSKLNSTKG